MRVFIVWFLVFGDGHSSQVIGRFMNEVDCNRTRVELATKSQAEHGMNTQHGVCISAEVRP